MKTQCCTPRQRSRAGMQSSLTYSHRYTRGHVLAFDLLGGSCQPCSLVICPCAHSLAQGKSPCLQHAHPRPAVPLSTPQPRSKACLQQESSQCAGDGRSSAHRRPPSVSTSADQQRPFTLFGGARPSGKCPGRIPASGRCGAKQRRNSAVARAL